jgi:hypothetical protein
MKKWSLSVFVTLLGVSVVFGNQYKSSAIGSWSATTTWQISTDGGSSFSAASSVPGTSVSDTVLIRDGDTVTINQSAKIAALTLGGGTTGGLKYENVTTIRVLEVTGDFIMNAGSAFNHGISVTVIRLPGIVPVREELLLFLIKVRQAIKPFPRPVRPVQWTLVFSRLEEPVMQIGYWLHAL